MDEEGEEGVLGLLRRDSCWLGQVTFCLTVEAGEMNTLIRRLKRKLNSKLSVVNLSASRNLVSKP
jgi:hypothetical protein